MEGTGKELIKHLSYEDVIEIHRLQMEFGGDHLELAEKNMLTPGSLEYLLNLIQGFIFPYDQYPTIVEKAAILGHRIITGHMFYDGNKRTGMTCCYTMLELNGYKVKIDNYDTEITAKAVASNKIDYQQFLFWLQQRIKSVNN